MPITQTHGGCVRRSSATRYSRRRGGLAGPLPRRPRRLLEQQPTEPARGQPQPQHAGQPKQQSRLPGCQDTPPPEPASSRSRRVRKGVSRTGHDEEPPVGGKSGVRLSRQRRRTPLFPIPPAWITHPRCATRRRQSWRTRSDPILRGAARAPPNPPLVGELGPRLVTI